MKKIFGTMRFVMLVMLSIVAVTLFGFYMDTKNPYSDIKPDTLVPTYTEVALNFTQSYQKPHALPLWLRQ